jgi:hypothetical protein
MGRLSNAERERRASVKETEVEEKPPIAVEQPVEPEKEKKKPFEPYEPTGETAGAKKGRASFTLDENGRPDLGSMRESTKAQFKQWMSDPAIRAQLGVEGGTVLPPAFTEDDIRNFFLMFGPIEGYIVALAMKVPPQLAVKVFTYSETDLAMVVPATTAIANKYQEYLTWYGSAKEEINFFMAMFASTSAKLRTLQAEWARMKEEIANENPNPATQWTKPPDTGEHVDGGIRITEVVSVADGFAAGFTPTESEVAHVG